MNPYRTYQGERASAMPRIEILLQLYDGIFQSLETGLEFLKKEGATAARPFLARSRALISGMASSIDLSYGDLPKFFLQLYEFVLHNLALGGISNVEAALRVLTILREGLLAIRPEALLLERNGTIPPVEQKASLLTVA